MNYMMKSLIMDVMIAAIVDGLAPELIKYNAIGY